MAHHAPIRPRISVVMAVQDGAGHLVRAVDSVLNQSFSQIELVLVSCSVQERTAASLERFRERDIRVEVVSYSGDDPAEALARGMRHARGSMVMLMRQDDWLAPGVLEGMDALSEDEGARMVIPARSEDVWGDDGEPQSSCVRHAETHTWSDASELRRDCGALYEAELLSAYGMLVSREIAGEALGAFDEATDGLGYVLACLDRTDGLVVWDGPFYHSVSFGSPDAGPLDPALAERCAAEHACMMACIERWGLSGDTDATAPVHRRHVRRLISCIDNTSMGSSRISSVERVGRVQKLIDAEDARASLTAVQPSAHEFGIMFKPMVKRNAAGCCMGSRLRALLRLSHIPLGSLL